MFSNVQDNNNENTNPNPSMSEQPQTQSEAVQPVQQQETQTQQPEDVIASANPISAINAPTENEHHNVFRSIMEVLAGPSFNYKIDPNTGEMQKVPVQRTKSQLANSIVAGALTGMFAGAQQRGAGSKLRSFGAGGQAVAEKQDQQDQEKRQMASADFARHASIFETNMRTYQNQLQLSQMDYNMHKLAVDGYGEIYGKLKDIPGAIVSDGVSESDLTKYHVTKQNAIPVGIVPKLGEDGQQIKNEQGIPLWENTYAIVNPVSLELSDELRKKAEEWGLPGLVKPTGEAAKLPQSVTMKSQNIINLQGKIQSLEQAQNELNNYYNELEGNTKKTVGPTFDDEEIQNKINEAADKHGIDRGLFAALVKQESGGNPKATSKKGAQGLTQLMPETAKALGVTDAYDVDQNLEGGATHFKRLLDKYEKPELALAAYNAGEGRVNDSVPNIPETKDYVKSIMEMVKPDESEKNDFDLKSAVKSDPTLINAISAYQKYSAMPVNEALDAMSKDKQAAPYVGKIAALFGGKDKIIEYTNKKAEDLKQKAVDRAVEQEVKKKEELAKLENKELYLGIDPNLTGDEFMQELVKKDNNVANIVKKISDYDYDLRSITNRGKQRDRYMALVARYDPTFDQTQYEAKSKLRQEFASGKASANVRSLNTLVHHIETYKKAADALKNSDYPLWNLIANKGITSIGDPRVKNFLKAADAVAGEASTLFKGTAGTDQEIKEWRKNLNDTDSQDQINGGVDKMLELLSGRLYALEDQWMSGMGKPRNFKILSKSSSKTLTDLGRSDLVNSDLEDFKGAKEQLQNDIPKPNQNPAPDGTVITMPDGSKQIKKDGKWIPQ